MQIVVIQADIPNTVSEVVIGTAIRTATSQKKEANEDSGLITINRRARRLLPALIAHPAQTLDLLLKLAHFLLLP
jgi:hypothetical protein